MRLHRPRQRVVRPGVYGHPPSSDASVSERQGGVVDLYWIYVLPEYWNEGIGSRLLDRTSEALVERGIGRLRLGVLAANDKGVRFYESRRFERIEAGETNFADGVRKYTYAKEL